MEPKIPERKKKPGVCYAVTNDGIELPAVDVTHPTFAVEVGPADLAAISEATLRSLQKTSKMPSLVLRFLARHSIIMRETLEASGSYLSGMAAYIQKLGPENLGEGYAGRIDKRLVSSIGPVSGRLRLRDIARLTADGLAPALSKRGGPIHLVNIGGGAAPDSVNALILILKERPDQLRGREVFLHVLDIDKAGPDFGARVLEAMQAEGGPLHGAAASFKQVRYDWADVSVLRDLLVAIGKEAVAAGSSEGALFEYGSDEEIVANLRALRDGTPDDFVMVGSVVRDEPLLRLMKQASRMTFQLRDLKAFVEMVRGAGWVVDRCVEGNPMYHILRLKKA